MSEEGMTSYEIGAVLGKTPATIRQLWKNYGMIHNTSFKSKKDQRDLEKAALIEKMAVKGLSSAEIGEAIGLTPTGVRSYFRRYGIKAGRARGSQPGSYNTNWKGGRRINDGGYYEVAVKEHPHKNNCGYVREHRLVMEQIIGRYLKPEETVHHIDGNRLNNAPENLMLFESKSAHRKHHADMNRH